MVKPVRYMTALLFIFMLLLLPFVSLYFGSGSILLTVFIAIYFIIIFNLLLVYRILNKINFSKSQFIKLAFDSIACPPFALNLVRKISLAAPIVGNPILLAKETLSAVDFFQLIQSLCRRLDDAIAFEDFGSEREVVLKIYLDKLRDLIK